MTEEKKLGKHVIFLGAGASMSSGYPSAVQLRKLIASPDAFLKYVDEHLGTGLKGGAARDCWAKAEAFRRQFSDVLEIFRNGGYGSVDEFCYLARGNNPNDVQKLKALMSFVLAVPNPESKFDESDYYPFIQRLFKPNTDALRDDICVITFNYDPYPEFLLRRAVATRARAAKGRAHKCPTDRAVLSGFYPGPKDCEDNWQKKEGFCVLKLHGTIAICREDLSKTAILNFDDIMEREADYKLDGLIKKLSISQGDVLPNVPVFFPWEILDDGLGYQQGHENWRRHLPFDEHQAGGGISTLVQEIWDRARAEVQQAAKVSFVGLSAHPYLHAAFKKLFLGKRGDLKVAVANRDRDVYLMTEGRYPRLHPTRAAVRLSELLHSICPKELHMPSPADMYSYSVGQFSEFIDKEMDPVPQ